MPLTSLLKDRDCDLSLFFKETLPRTRRVVTETNPDLKSLDTVRGAGGLGRWYATLGTAIDYRLRYYFPPTPVDQLVAFQGAYRLCNEDGNGDLVDVIGEFFDSICDLLNDIQPAAERLEPDQERELCRYCFLLALFDQIVRAGLGPYSRLSSLSEPSLEAILGLAPEVCVEDLCLQSWLCYDRLGDQTGKHHVLNPTFSGSGDVGGADADLILDRCLIDFKSTINPKISGGWLHQLVGYALLDYENRYQITDVAIYFARQGELVQWDLVDLIRRLSPGSPPTVDHMRAQLRQVLTT